MQINMTGLMLVFLMGLAVFIFAMVYHNRTKRNGNSK
jgi:hypothetical protein